MARILLAWELGGGLGHVSMLLPIAQALTQDGHEIVLAVRNVEAASKILKEYRGAIVQAPIHHVRCGVKRNPAVTYAELLYNCGFDDPESLQARMCAWQSLLRMARCDAMVAEHAPTALAATFGMALPRLVIGTGFTCPSPTNPLPNLRPTMNPPDATADRFEGRVLAVVQRAMNQLGMPKLSNLADLYYSCDEVMLKTFAELDPFPRTDGTRYWAPDDTFRGQMFQWPGDKRKKRIFAYLKPSPGLPELLECLKTSQHSTVVYGSWVTPKLMDRHNCKTLRLSPHALDLEQAAGECDLGILNATHGATSKFLLAGKPLLMLPHVQEQALTADRVQQMGGGLCADHRNGKSVANALERLVENGSFGRNASKFAYRYDRKCLAKSRQAAVDRIHDIVSS
ncbi:MAG: hypothetical protein ACI9HK_004827 [Pirellulaceae bacterium]|jgi:hypothetical protein